MELSEIQLKKLERIRSIYYMVSEGSQNIEKAISNELSYANVVYVEKTGREIKSSLTNEIIDLTKEKLLTYKEMESLVEQIGQSPNSSFDDYIIEGWRGKIEVPKKYCSSQIYIEGNESKDNMFKYNNFARRYVELSIETKKIQTIINTLSENKTYKLTVDIASKLGF